MVNFMKPAEKPKTEQATFGAGCFWGVEELFRAVPGVIATQVGFMGGTRVNPTYQDVCSHTTNHAEVVHLEFDPGIISYKELLRVFWENHNPTTPNRQGPDVGSQYRSVIFYHSEAQRKAAEQSKKELESSRKWSNRIVTQIVQAQAFYPAEEYHQKYLMKRGMSACHI